MILPSLVPGCLHKDVATLKIDEKSVGDQAGARDASVTLKFGSSGQSST